jgi:hypothetical protein
MEEEKVKCTNCKCNRIQSDFIGKSGNIVKRCLKCREKDAKQKKRPDVIEKRNKQQNEKKYYIKHREKKREENEEEYLKHNAENMKNWCNKNKEHLSEWRTQNFTHRFWAIKQQAQKKSIIWNEDLTDEICYKMMTSNCFYCNFTPDKSLNGIDRMDSMGSYEKINTVSCCKNCNFIKGSLDPKTFIKRCQHISSQFGGNGILNKDVWPDSNSTVYSKYLYRASKKDLDFALTKEQFTNFTANNCYYCDKESSKTHTNGIDRKDNSIGYIIENCASCCSQCNYMKGSLTEDDFIETCKRVSDYNLKNNIQIPNIDKCESKITKREKHTITKIKIVVTKQQPNKEKEVKAPIEKYIHKKREYVKGNNLPENCKIMPNQIPINCYYIPETDKRGDSFCVNRTHAKQNGKDWKTTSSKKVSIEEKYNQMMAYLNNEEYNVKQELELPKKKKSPPKPKTYSDEIYIEIFKLKHNTSEDASKIIKDKFQIIIKRDIISKIWLGDLDVPENLKETPEYNQMKSLTKKRTVKSKKFTKDELEWILLNNIDKSLGDRVKLFEDKFNKTITKAYLSKLIKN